MGKGRVPENSHIHRAISKSMGYRMSSWCKLFRVLFENSNTFMRPFALLKNEQYSHQKPLSVLSYKPTQNRHIRSWGSTSLRCAPRGMPSLTTITSQVHGRKG